MSEENGMRLQKYLASRGIASRRAAETMIAAGRVKVNGRVVTEMGIKIDPLADRVCVDNQQLAAAERPRYILLHKPAGYITSVHDERGRRTALNLLDGVRERVYPVGRLDYDTSGLLLFTNDGDLTQHLLHPSHEVEKTYLALVEGCPDNAALAKLKNGVRLTDGMTAPAKVRVMGKQEKGILLEISIHEGRNRQIKRMLEAVGHNVLHLKRIRMGFLDVKELPLGKWRDLSGDEVRRLKQL